MIIYFIAAFIDFFFYHLGAVQQLYTTCAPAIKKLHIQPVQNVTTHLFLHPPDESKSSIHSL